MKRFDIIPFDLNPTIGHEMSKNRPCVIISPDEMNENLRTVIIAPITSAMRPIPSRILIRPSIYNKLKEDSYIVLDQIRTVDKARLWQPAIGHLTAEEALITCKTLCEMFEL